MDYKVFKYLSLFILSIIFFHSCTKDNITNPIETNTGINLINGKIENWTYGDSITIIASTYASIYSQGDSLYIFGISKVNKDGNFIISLNRPPNILNIEYANGAYTFSDTGAKFTLLNLMLFTPNGSLFSNIYNASDNYDQLYHVGGYYIYFEYADRDVILTGKDYLNNKLGSIIISHHIVFKKGWNRISTKIISIDNNVYNFVREVNDTLGGKWFLE
ncbi:MAG: hypothetical protein P4L45_14570 [Ignavibacteriaceae bacterium]|nr:hypothetical protein [Ignavibacteriaceae bacterium]